MPSSTGPVSASAGKTASGATRLTRTCGDTRRGSISSGRLDLEQGRQLRRGSLISRGIFPKATRRPAHHSESCQQKAAWVCHLGVDFFWFTFCAVIPSWLSGLPSKRLRAHPSPRCTFFLPFICASSVERWPLERHEPMQNLGKKD